MFGTIARKFFSENFLFNNMIISVRPVWKRIASCRERTCTRWSNFKVLLSCSEAFPAGQMNVWSSRFIPALVFFFCFSSGELFILFFRGQELLLAGEFVLFGLRPENLVPHTPFGYKRPCGWDCLKRAHTNC